MCISLKQGNNYWIHMCSPVSEREQAWGAHLSQLGQPVLTTNQQFQHKTSARVWPRAVLNPHNCCFEVEPRAPRAEGMRPRFADVQRWVGLLLLRTTRLVLLRSLHLLPASSAHLSRPRWSLFRMLHIPLALLQTFHPHQSTLWYGPKVSWGC